MVITITGQKTKGNLSLVRIQILQGTNVEDLLQLLTVYENGVTVLEKEIKGSSDYINMMFNNANLDHSLLKGDL